MRVMLGTDGSPDAVLATDWLAHFPLPRESTIRIVSVVPALPSGVQPLREQHESLSAYARQVAEEAQAKLGPRSVDVRVLEGHVRVQLLEAAQAWEADVIVLGARGLSGLERALLGSVSLGVAREARCAVMIVKGTAKSVQRIVVGLDGSEDAGTALTFLTQLPLPAETDVVLVGVAEKIYFPRSAPGLVAERLRASVAQIEEEDKLRKQQVLLEAERLLKGKTRVQVKSLVGNPADEIVSTAATTRAQLVVLGNRGLGGVQRVLLGSVSERVLLQAECTVLIVKQ